jgi:hypothetical protein
MEDKKSWGIKRCKSNNISSIPRKTRPWATSEKVIKSSDDARAIGVRMGKEVSKSLRLHLID